MSYHKEIEKLPMGMLADAVPISSNDSGYSKFTGNSFSVRDEPGVHLAGNIYLEIKSGGHLVKSIYGSVIGVLFLMGLGISLLMSLIIPSPAPSEVCLTIALTPIFSAAFGGLLCAATRSIRGGYV